MQQKAFSFRGLRLPPDTLIRGSVPGSRWDPTLLHPVSAIPSDPRGDWKKACNDTAAVISTVFMVLYIYIDIKKFSYILFTF